MRTKRDLQAENTNNEVKTAVEPNTKVITDKYRGYNSLKEVVASHHAMECPKEQADKLLLWVHTIELMVSTCKSI